MENEQTPLLTMQALSAHTFQTDEMTKKHKESQQQKQMEYFSDDEQTPQFREAASTPNNECNGTQTDTYTNSMGFGKRPRLGSTADEPPRILEFDQIQRNLDGKVHQRTLEEAALYRSFLVTMQRTHTTVAIISGPCGSGKSKLARTIQPQFEKAGGCFVKGKFDLLRGPEPYAAFVAALTEYTNKIKEQGEEKVVKIRASILEALDDEVCVLTRMIPALKDIVGEKHEIQSEAKAEDAVQKFVFVFRLFLRAVSSQEHPLVLLLEDLQFADACSLDLLFSIATDRKNENLSIIGTCGDSLPADSYLVTKLNELEAREEIDLLKIELHNFDENGVQLLVADVLDADREQCKDLAELIYHQTRGNMLYILEIFRWLQAKELLSLNEDRTRWLYDRNEIAAALHPCNRADFLLDRIKVLPNDVQYVLKVAACIGYYIDQKLVEYVVEGPVREVLEVARDNHCLDYNEGSGGYEFPHDGYQLAAYSLIPASEKELFHVEIGRRLWRKLGETELDRQVFLVLSQLSSGRSLILKEKERYSVAMLCLSAGQKAAKLSTFRTASIYLNFGLDLLGDNSWRTNYDLTLALHNAAAEMELCIANYERMNSILDVVFKNASSFRDKVQSYATQIYYLGTIGKQQDAIDTGIEVLKGLGETFPTRLCRINLMREFRRVRRQLRAKSDEQILRMPLMVDQEKLACLQILQLIFVHALLARPTFAPFVQVRMVAITLRYGLSVIASAAFATFGMFNISTVGDIDAAFRFGELGLQLLERFEAMEYLPRVYAAYYGCIYAWKKPIRGALGPLLKAHRIGMQTGDFEFASLCANLYCSLASNAGIPLDVISREWSAYQDRMVSNRQLSLMTLSVPGAQLVHHFLGLTPDPLASQGDLMDFDMVLKHAEEMKMFVSIAGLRMDRLLLAYVFNDDEIAEKYFGKEVLHWMVPPSFELLVGTFFKAMVALNMARRGKKVRENIRFARRTIKTLRHWASYAPQNCLDRFFLAKAELASVRGQDRVAYALYTAAIAIAKDAEFPFMVALSHERAARHLLGIRGDRSVILEHFEKACVSYGEWGGLAKQKRMRAEIDSLFPPSEGNSDERNLI